MGVSAISGGSQSYSVYPGASSGGVERSSSLEFPRGPRRCRTCAEREYKDGSDDPSVTFKTATHISPEAAPAAVAAHEQMHVRNDRASAAAPGREVVSQSVTIQSGVCPECGREYVSGGKTTTVTRAKAAPDNTPSGRLLDLFA